MLVLTRKEGESILIGDDIEVTVSEVRGGRIKLAISAPREVLVMRREVAERVGGCLLAGSVSR
jgi:carbon storage regulator